MGSARCNCGHRTAATLSENGRVADLRSRMERPARARVRGLPRHQAQSGHAHDPLNLMGCDTLPRIDHHDAAGSPVSVCTFDGRAVEQGPALAPSCVQKQVNSMLTIMLCVTMPLVTRHSKQCEESRSRRCLQPFEMLRFAQDDSKAMDWLKSHESMSECNLALGVRTRVEARSVKGVAVRRLLSPEARRISCGNQGLSRRGRGRGCRACKGQRGCPRHRSHATRRQALPD